MKRFYAVSFFYFIDKLCYFYKKNKTLQKKIKKLCTTSKLFDILITKK